MAASDSQTSIALDNNLVSVIAGNGGYETLHAQVGPGTRHIHSAQVQQNNLQMGVEDLNVNLHFYDGYPKSI